MKRIILMVIRNIFYLPYAWIKLCHYAKHVDKYTEEERYAFLKDFDRHANRAGRITIEQYGVENIPSENGFIFYPNHQGLYDVLAIMEACPKPFGVVNKKEVQNTPFLKQVFACMEALSMDRDDIKQALGVIIEVSKQVKAGRNFLIFPEGTRSRNGNEVQEFKGGSFKSAMKAKCPIVPIAIIDSYKSFDTNSIKKLTVQVHFLEEIPFEQYKDLKTNEIARVVRERIEETIKKYDKTDKNR